MTNSISRVTLPDGVDYNIIANGIHYGQVDSTSTSTNFTATIPGITEYYDGLTIMLKNGVVTSAANFTININGLGAKGSYSNMSAATRDTTIFNINYTMMFIYDSTRVSGGCWVCYRGYYSEGGGSTVSVSQELSSGTEIASIEVDGVSTSLYSPTPPSPSDATPQPTGTASAGSSSDYSRADHVHQKPTYTASEVGALPDSTTIPSKTSDLTNDSGFITGMTILSYGHSTWQDFLDACSANKVVYCRASSNSNPATGSQTRMAFMAYVNNADNPTNVEFQYYRSVSSHSATQQGDQVYVYKLDKTAGWTVTVRESYTKIVAGSGLSSDYSSGTLTLSNGAPVPTGGTTGQVLKKRSNTNYDTVWANESGGSGGGLFVATFSDDPLNAGEVVCDKTAAEISAAFNGGTPIIGYYNGIILYCEIGNDLDGLFRGHQYIGGTVRYIEIYFSSDYCSMYSNYNLLKYVGYFQPSRNTFSLETSARDSDELFEFFTANGDGECVACVTIDSIVREFTCARRGIQHDSTLGVNVFFARFTCSEVVENNGVYELHVFSFDSKQYRSDPSTIVVQNYAEKKVVLSAV